jgi:hypothetical protein
MDGEAAGEMVQVNDPDCPDSTLIELSASASPEVSEAALGRLIRRRADGELQRRLAESAPEDVLGTTLAVLCEVLEQLPANVLNRSPESLSSSIGVAGFSKGTSALVSVLLDAFLGSRGSKVEEIARALAVNYPGTLVELLETSVQLSVAG